MRSDAKINYWYLVDTQTHTPAWATSQSVGGTKDTLLPAVLVTEDMLVNGAWKKNVEWSDYIIDIDNKSINHRPDLWGHRGIAQEIAAIFNLSLKPIEAIITSDDLLHKNTSKNPLTVTIKNTGCKTVAAVSLTTENSPSLLPMIIRLHRLDHKAINTLVDFTNYTMLDLGHPMHAFDLKKYDSSSLIVRSGSHQEKLTLLDGETIELNNTDLVIANEKKAVSLAGIMGGLDTAIDTTTDSVLLEVGCFDAATIRRSAHQHKKRTDASMRFEKSLDRNNLETVIKRFLFLLQENSMPYQLTSSLVKAGENHIVHPLYIQHEKIESLLGCSIETKTIISVLEKLSFAVTINPQSQSTEYKVVSPSFRETKEPLIQEDIIEEIGRMIGYDSIIPTMPTAQLSSKSMAKTYNIRKIKNILSSGLLMKELYSYSFFDEVFLRELNYNPEHCIFVKNPISENFTRLACSLQPHMLKAIKENSVDHQQLRFYEYARVWHITDQQTISEKKSLTGIFFDHSSKMNFYEGKKLIGHLFEQFHCAVDYNHMTFHTHQYPWLSKHQVAQISYKNQPIGIMGTLTPETINLITPSSSYAGFIFEIDGDFLTHFKKEIVRFKPLEKYPSVYRDISVIAPLAITAQEIVNIIKSQSAYIQHVDLIDFFTKKEWLHEKSLTFRVQLYNDQKTLEAQEIDQAYHLIVAALQSKGVTVR